MGGIFVASELHKLMKDSVHVTIVDARDYVDWSPAAARCCARPQEAESTPYVFPLDKVAEYMGATFRQGKVTSVSGTSVQLEDGVTIDGDYIVVAIGGHYGDHTIWKPTPDMNTTQKRLDGYKHQNSRIASASSIVVVGAGFTGVEVAGEIKSAYPHIQVTLVGNLVPQLPPKYRDNVQLELERLGVILKSGRVEQNENEQTTASKGQVTTTEGETIDADIVYYAAGFQFSGGALFPKDSSFVTSNGQLQCRPTLQLLEKDGQYDHIFACGDIVAIPENKYGGVAGVPQAQELAKTVAQNIQSLASGNAESLVEYPWSDKPVTLSAIVINPDVCVGAFGLPSFMACIENGMGRYFKSKDFLVSMNAAKFGKGTTWN